MTSLKFALLAAAMVTPTTVSAATYTYSFDLEMTEFYHDRITLAGPQGILGPYFPSEEERAEFLPFDPSVDGNMTSGKVTHDPLGSTELQIGNWVLRGGTDICDQLCSNTSYDSASAIEFSINSFFYVAAFNLIVPTSGGLPSMGTLFYQDDLEGTYVSTSTSEPYSYGFYGSNISFNLTNFEEVPDIPKTPLPASSIMLGAGLGALVWMRRRKRAA